jgi:hypothetical protein
VRGQDLRPARMIKSEPARVRLVHLPSLATPLGYLTLGVKWREHGDMSSREALVGQIVRLLDIRLLDPLEVLLEGDESVSALRQIVRLRAGQWAAQLHDGDDTTAVRAAIRLIATLYPDDRAFDPPVDWWRTPLGGVVARRVGHPAAEAVSYATAGAMLGITRQGVHDLVRRGRLPRHPDGGVPSAAIRDRLRGSAPTTNPWGEML